MSALALICAVGAFVFALVAVRITTEKNARSLSLKRMTKLEAEMTDIADALQAVRESMHKLRSRTNMRNLRANGKSDDSGEPSDPEQWRVWARRQFITQKDK